MHVRAAMDLSLSIRQSRYTRRNHPQEKNNLLLPDFARWHYAGPPLDDDVSTPPYVCHFAVVTCNLQPK